MKNLLEKVNEELAKNGLEFTVIKEFNTKFKGKLVDIKSGIYADFEIQNCLQFNMIKSFAKFCRNYMDMYVVFVKNKIEKGS